MDQALENLNWSAALLDGLVETGVQQLVVSPGSRNTPLMLAGEQHPALEVGIQVDERSAAFFALGVAKATGRPVAIVATSGSALANWFPAVMEASHAGIPLILISADRPWELQQCGANQTVDQHQLFGTFCRAFFALPPVEAGVPQRRRLRQLARQAVDKACGLDPGPVQINLPFREPLVTTQLATFEQDQAAAPPVQTVLRVSSPVIDRVQELLSGRPGIIVAGPDCGGPGAAAAVNDLAEALAVPVLADPLSGLRWTRKSGSRVSTHYDLYLQWPEFLARAPGWVLRIGAMPVSRRLQEYLEHHRQAIHLVIEERGRWQDPLGLATEMIHADSTDLCSRLAKRDLRAADADWGDLFGQADQAVEDRLEHDPGEIPLEGQLIRRLLQALPDQSLLFCGNSLSIRYLDAYSMALDKSLEVTGNRGVSGIDGNISTLMGLAAGARHQRKVVGITGDLAFFHDLNGLTLADRGDAVLILFNNDGGGIFEHLPQAGLPGFSKLWKTPLGLDYQQAARLFNVDYERVDTLESFAGSFERALESDNLSIIEIMVDSRHSRDAHRFQLKNA